MANYETLIAVMIPKEHDIKLRMIAATMQSNKSQIVRIALSDFLNRYEISTLPHPEDGEAVPVITIKGE